MTDKNLKDNFMKYARLSAKKYVTDFEPELTGEELEDAVDYICDALWPPLCDELVCDLLDSWHEERHLAEKSVKSTTRD